MRRVRDFTHHKGEGNGACEHAPYACLLFPRVRPVFYVDVGLRGNKRIEWWKSVSFNLPIIVKRFIRHFTNGEVTKYVRIAIVLISLKINILNQIERNLSR